MNSPEWYARNQRGTPRQAALDILRAAQTACAREPNMRNNCRTAAVYALGSASRHLLDGCRIEQMMGHAGFLQEYGANWERR